ncbi:hypothetical protein [Gloeobacter morelensis]|uniref:Uncharacterized protein n=1 Tax=Gloeobacter morelensis MG652769 TaxID=2781736 RepID=A0ABY3PM00_9CYAN|nr:hypothetical protein [Gloeobacter morelensis]UFP94629.1 hypothetical protein ISF26_23340 [Gloeobacter morelensis MG652769]
MNDRNHDPGQQPQQQESNGPADVLRDGNIKATIWKNERENGPSYNTTFARTWQDESGAYRDSHSFSGTELLRVSELARGAYARTNELRQEHRQELEVEITRDDEDTPPQDQRETFRSKRGAQEQEARSQTVSRRK